MHSKSQKQLVLTGAARFNARPKTGLAFLEENKLIYADLSPNVSKAHSLATFLKNCTRLDKRLLGDFISKPDNIEILKAFIGLFDFKNVGLPNSSYFSLTEFGGFRNLSRRRCEKCLKLSGFLAKRSK
jgi:Sec7-like guanine-nucleotide exchange factor